jgi:DNA segregation ATPase FtsK/SpoIIIE-like protein
MRHIARKRARRRAGEAATQWPDLLAALARGEAGPGVQAHQRHALAGVLGELGALRQDPPPQVVVLIDEVDVLAQQACGPLGAELARRLEKGRSAGVALALVESRPTATWIT